MRGAQVSTVKYKTLSPSWVGEELRLSVPHYRCWRSFIEEAHIFAELLDEDKYTKDDFMGACVLGCEVRHAAAPPTAVGPPSSPFQSSRALPHPRPRTSVAA